ncbi:hypothetical protein SAMN05661096_01949 [Marivirga sericea]|uniref:Septum formation inhibitor Maf n=1 Tax=Marivirga sericea TaxID=1028 RepID=A0A1X7JPL7_9BACT|nr:hypothetical protein [Marivirga sericea]SMG30189.1 hypothetical protein SAMN05661096_01949 [Marivirga sericea]
MKNILIITFLFVLFQGCGQKKEQAPQELISFSIDQNFGDYWYQGKAELTSYELEQVRYGEKRKGEAVLIFVTEDFSKSKQVKLDNPSANSDDAEKVMKLNFTKKFNTGIYPYSIMTSVFAPVYPKSDLHARKLTTSVQEWCGHVFMQLNNETNQYNLLSRSYFESEGDLEMSLDKIWLEDELWTLIRLDPAQIPEGEIKLLPSTQYLRLKHKDLKAYTAMIKVLKNEHLNELKIQIPALERKVSIFYQNKFPYDIESWEESYPEGGEIMTTSAKLKKRIMLDYWKKNSVQDSTFRKELSLGY